MEDEKEKAELLKKALTIVDELAKLDVDEVIDNSDDLQFLIERAHKLTKHRLWKLR